MLKLETDSVSQSKPYLEEQTGFKVLVNQNDKGEEKIK